MTNQFLLFAVCYAISPLAFLKPPFAPERTTRSTRASGFRSFTQCRWAGWESGNRDREMNF
jgi:hypothetical protein